MIAQLREKGILAHLNADPQTKTITKVRIVGQNQQLIRLDFEEKSPLNRLENQLINDYKSALAHVHAVILSDYAKGALSNIRQLIQLARAAGKPVLIDPKSEDFEMYRDATLVTPNLKEFEAVVGPCESDSVLEEKARHVIKRYNFEALLVTRGAKGMVLIPKNQPATFVSARAREVYDVTGAGDTVIAVLAAGVAAGLSWKEAAQLANLAASIVVGKFGAATVTPAELQRVLLRAQDHHRGVLTEEQLMTVVVNARAHQETIVMTNGCFDILHAGHAQYLEQAKRLGDYLIVAVNDDASVKRLKGEKRPYNSLQSRMQVLASLRAVDMVVSFSEDTPGRLIQKILPDYLVKGGDYKAEEIVGADVVTAQGGKVIILDFKPGCSTTQLIEEIIACEKEGETT